MKNEMTALFLLLGLYWEDSDFRTYLRRLTPDGARAFAEHVGLCASWAPPAIQRAIEVAPRYADAQLLSIFQNAAASHAGMAFEMVPNFPEPLDYRLRDSEGEEAWEKRIDAEHRSRKRQARLSVFGSQGRSRPQLGDQVQWLYWRIAEGKSWVEIHTLANRNGERYSENFARMAVIRLANDLGLKLPTLSPGRRRKLHI